MRTAIAIILACSLLGMAGCVKHVVAPLPPGAINQFDADTYNVLVTTQAAILQAKAEFGSDYYGAINKAIIAYNAALSAYTSWHNAGGGSVAIVQAAVASMLSAIADVNKQKGVTPKPVSRNIDDLSPPTRIARIQVQRKAVRQ